MKLLNIFFGINT